MTPHAVYIPSLDGKDIYISNNYLNPDNNGYRLKRPDGAYNLRRFRNTFDYSLDLIKVREVFEKANHYAKFDQPFSFTVDDKEYTPQLINVTFKYSVREYNRINSDTYVKFGYCINDCDLADCVAYNSAGELIAIQVGKDVKKPSIALPKNFIFVQGEDDVCGHYETVGNIQRVMSVADIRRWVYMNGFWADGVHYVRFKRSSGSARVGKCVFINERLYGRMHQWEKCGLTVRKGQAIDLAAWESYIALTSSSIIDTLELDPKSILVIQDYESVFNDRVMKTSVVNKHLTTAPSEYVVRNSIWDGQSLIDISAMGSYACKGMVLMRNRFFKSCCFNTNIQQWFEDNGVTELSQLNGITRAGSVKDIKLITTPSSIKYLKFGTLDMWLDNIDSTFGVVKYEKKPHFFDGDLVQVHYQLLNTLQMTYQETEELLQPTFDYINALINDPAVMRNYLKYTSYTDGDIVGAKTKNDIINALLNINDRFQYTKMYRSFACDLFNSKVDHTKKGHILVNGNYSTLFGNPIEMLLQAIGRFDEKSQLGIGHIHSTRFAYGQTILGSRSPHVTMGNVWLPFNVEDPMIDKYFNLTTEICCMNSIGENVLARLSGSDFDSDTAMLTDNELMIRVARRNYNNFLVPTSTVSADKINRFFTDEQKADLDIKTSVNKIGEIINFSQILNSLLWDNIAHGETLEQNMELYADISQLDVMSNLEIDKAKKIFEIDNAEELRLLKQKYNLVDEDGKDIRPDFFKHLDRSKGYYIKGRRNYKKHKTTMDYIQQIVYAKTRRMKSQSCLRNDGLSVVLDSSKYDSSLVYYDQVARTVQLIEDFDKETRALYSRDNLDKDEKQNVINHITFELTRSLSEMKYSYSTAYYLIMLTENKDYSGISKKLFYTLLSSPATRFFEVFDQSRGDISVIERTESNEYFYSFYGLKFAKSVLNGGKNFDN